MAPQTRGFRAGMTRTTVLLATHVLFCATLTTAQTVTSLAGYGVSQSSTLVWEGIAQDAHFGADGNLATRQETTASTNPWFQIDLGGSGTVSTIEIYNRADSDCKYRMLTASCDVPSAGITYNGANQGAKVGVSTTPCSSGTCGGTVCKAIQQLSDLNAGTDNKVTVTCPSDTVGRFIYLQYQGGGRIIHIREIKAAISGAPVPLTGVTATQSSTFEGQLAAYAVDANPLTRQETSQGASTWLQIDLGAVKVVSTIALVNRVACGSRLLDGVACEATSTLSSSTVYNGANQGVNVGVAETAPCSGSSCAGGTGNILCRFITSSAELSNQVVAVQCPANTFGRFLYVQLPGTRILHLLDVLTVMGDAEKTPCHSCIGDLGFQYSNKFKAVEAS